MAEKTLKLDVVTPEKQIISVEITSLIVPAIGGYLGVLSNHAPLISGLEPGVVKYKISGEYKRLAISGGFLEVSNNKSTIIASTAEMAEEIDVERAQAAKERAKTRLKSRESTDVARAEMALKRAIARLRATERL